MAMTAAERQRRRRAKLKNSDLNQIFVRGEGGEQDERIRVAFAVQSLAKNGELSAEVIEKIVERSEVVFPNNDQLTKKYIRKIVNEFLAQD